MAHDEDEDDRGIGIGALAAVTGGVLALVLATFAGNSATPRAAGTATDTSTTAAPAGDPAAAATQVAAAVEQCATLDRASGAQVTCARDAVTTAQAALVEGISANPDPTTVAALWEAQARAMAMGLGASDDPTAIYPAGSLPAPAAGPSANTVTCTPKPGTRRNLRTPGTENRPSGLGVGVCQQPGAVTLVALFRNSGGYYADGVATKACTGPRCAVQAPSKNRCGRYRSYVVTYHRSGDNVAGPIVDGWSPEQKYCNPPA